MADSRILECILAAIRDINEQLPQGSQLEASADTRLTGKDAHVESLTLVS